MEFNKLINESLIASVVATGGGEGGGKRPSLPTDACGPLF